MTHADSVVRARSVEDRERLWRAVLTHRERLLRISRGRTPTEQDAEDVVQEAMLRCVEFSGLDEERLGQFLTTVTVRLCADRYRERSHDARLHHKLAMRETPVPGPEDEVCERGEAQWLASLVDDLPEKQRDIVRARQAGLSHAEVAHRLRISYSAVESSIARARLRFRDALARGAGVAWPMAWRLSPCLEAATATAVIVGGVVVGSLAPRPALPTSTTWGRTAAPPHLAPLAQPAPPPRPVVHAPDGIRVTPQPTVDRKRPRPSPKPTPIASFGNHTLEPDNDDYFVTERAMHCVVYGIDTSDGFRCRYPNEGNQP